MIERKSLFELSTDDPAELNSLILRSRLVAFVVQTIKERGMKQADAAALLKTTQPRVSNLYKGELSKFSVDFLLSCVVRLGYKVEIDLLVTR